jgi:hypothetical protein
VAPTSLKRGEEWAPAQDDKILKMNQGRLAPSLSSVGVEQPFKSPNVWRSETRGGGPRYPERSASGICRAKLIAVLPHPESYAVFHGKTLGGTGRKFRFQRKRVRFERHREMKLGADEAANE